MPGALLPDACLLGQEGAGAADSVSQVGKALPDIGLPKAYLSAGENLESGFHATAHFRGGGAGENADHLPGQGGGGICCPCVKASGVGYPDGRSLGGLIQGDIGDVIAVGGQEPQAPPVALDPQSMAQGGGLRWAGTAPTELLRE